MKASLFSHSCKQLVHIETNSVIFKINGSSIRRMNLEIDSDLDKLKIYCTFSFYRVNSIMFNNKDLPYDLILEILKDAAAPESVINLVKLHRQNHELKRN